MKITSALLAILSATTAVAQTTPAARPAPARTGQASAAKGANAVRPPDPDLFDGSKFEKEVRPETGMIGEFEMPGSADGQDNKVGGNPAQGGGQPPPNGAASPAAAAGGAAGAPQQQQSGGQRGGQQGGASGGSSGGAEGSEGGAGGSQGAEGGAGAVGGALDQSKPMSNSGQSGGSSGGSAEGMQADQLKGGGAAADAAAKAAGQARASSGKIGSAELRIETLPESEKDVVGREAAAGGTQGSNRAMPSGGGGQGAQNQNKGVEKGKVIPKGL